MRVGLRRISSGLHGTSYETPKRDILMFLIKFLMNCLMKCSMKSLMEIFIPIGPKSRPGLKNPKTKIFALNINKGKFRKQKFRGEGRGVKTHQTSVKSLYPDRPLLIAWGTGQNVDGKDVILPCLLWGLKPPWPWVTESIG